MGVPDAFQFTGKRGAMKKGKIRGKEGTLSGNERGKYKTEQLDDFLIFSLFVCLFVLSVFVFTKPLRFVSVFMSMFFNFLFVCFVWFCFYETTEICYGFYEYVYQNGNFCREEGFHARESDLFIDFWMKVLIIMYLNNEFFL